MSGESGLRHCRQNRWMQFQTPSGAQPGLRTQPCYEFFNDHPVKYDNNQVIDDFCVARCLSVK